MGIQQCNSEQEQTCLQHSYPTQITERMEAIESSQRHQQMGEQMPYQGLVVEELIVDHGLLDNKAYKHLQDQIYRGTKKD